MKDIKKELQKVIGKIRKDTGDEYPKAMMTGQQMAKRTATVNCGGEWRNKETCARYADMVETDPRFLAFLAEFGATAHREPNPFGGVQIRIHY